MERALRVVSAQAQRSLHRPDIARLDIAVCLRPQFLLSFIELESILLVKGKKKGEGRQAGGLNFHSHFPRFQEVHAPAAYTRHPHVSAAARRMRFSGCGARPSPFRRRKPSSPASS